MTSPSAPQSTTSHGFTVRFDDLLVEEDAAVGPPGYYLRRPGFWIGSAGVAACWYGGAEGLFDALVAALRDTDRSDAGGPPGPH